MTEKKSRTECPFCIRKRLNSMRMHTKHTHTHFCLLGPIFRQKEEETRARVLSSVRNKRIFIWSSFGLHFGFFFIFHDYFFCLQPVPIFSLRLFCVIREDEKKIYLAIFARLRFFIFWSRKININLR